jgi:hypothetical protein
MSISNFHKQLLGVDPTPEQNRLYEAFPKQRGFSSEEQNSDRFVATFIAALADTWDGDAKACTFKVPLAIPRAIEPWCIDQINLFVETMKVRRKLIPDKRFIPHFLQAMKHVETGTRVFSMVEAPKRWTAFGFSVDSVAPEWLKEGLLVL